jgi:protein TonB
MTIKSASKTKLVIFLVSAVLHTALLFFVIFTTQAETAEIEEATLVSLVDVSEIKEEPKPLVIKPRVETKVEEAPKEIIPVQDEIAEILIETEEAPPVVETTAAHSGPVGTAVKTTASSSGGSGEAASRYLKSNYNYIQKRIMRELIYPSQAKRTGLQGVVEIVFIINMDGTIREAAVRKSSRHTLLDDEALRAVQSAAPFRKPDAPVKIVIPVSFTLT